MYDVIGGWRGG